MFAVFTSTVLMDLERLQSISCKYIVMDLRNRLEKKTKDVMGRVQKISFKEFSAKGWGEVNSNIEIS